MSFHHPSVNELFGFKEDKLIPYVCIDNPLVYVLKAQKSMQQMTHNAAWNAAEL